MKRNCLSCVLLLALAIVMNACNQSSSQLEGVWRIYDISVDTTSSNGALAIIVLAGSKVIPEKIAITQHDLSVKSGDSTLEYFRYKISGDTMLLEKDGDMMPMQYAFDEKKQLTLSSKEIKLFLQK